MIKKKYVISTLILSLLCMNQAHAACTQEEINGFKKIEDEYKVTYSFDKETKTYNIFFKSPQSEKYHYRIYTEDELKCTAKDDITMECTHFKPDLYSIEIIGVSDKCNDVLKTFTLDLSKYNNYAYDPLCEGIEEFVLCNPTYKKEIDYETFVSRVETYKKTKVQKESENEIEREESDFVDDVINYMKNNLLQIVIIGVFIILVLITIIMTAKSIRKSRRLE